VSQNFRREYLRIKIRQERSAEQRRPEKLKKMRKVLERERRWSELSQQGTTMQRLRRISSFSLQR
jgi:hypothetical protein